MEITKEMVEEFNEWLRISRCIFRLKFTHIKPFDTPACEVVVANNTFIHSSIINLTDEFYDIMEEFFKDKGVSLINYNNTRTIFWNSK